MKAGLRLGLAMATAGLALAPAPLLGQSTSAPPANPPASEAIGPRELQNFSLNGTVTKPAEAPAVVAPGTSRAQPPRPATNRTASATPNDAPAAGATRPASEPSRTASVSRANRPANTGAPPSLAFSPATEATAGSAPQPGFAPAPIAVPTASLAPESGPTLWPWLLLAAILGGGGAFLLRRRRSSEALAGGPSVEAFVAPEPVAPRPATAPVPAPRTRPAAKPAGIVSTRLRPWIDIGFEPTGCVVNDDQVVVEFDVHLTNSGSAPARDVLVEASMFNAGDRQEQDISAFFANPEGHGERIETIAPLQNITIRTSLVAPRQNIQIFEVGGRQVFVPLVAFNALYRQSGGPAQTSAAYMLGRETDGDKLGPLRADLGAKAFTRLGTRSLPVSVRV